MVTAPMDCTSGRSNTGLNVLPPLIDFHTPPEAGPAKMVSRPFSFTASSAEMRPLMAAEPILRAGRPEIEPASKRTGVCPASPETAANAKKMV